MGSIEKLKNKSLALIAGLHVIRVEFRQWNRFKSPFLISRTWQMVWIACGEFVLVANGWLPGMSSTRITDPVSDSELHWLSLWVQTWPQLTSSSSDVSSMIGSNIELRCDKNPKSPFTWHSENCDAPYGIHGNDNDPPTSKLSILCSMSHSSCSHEFLNLFGSAAALNSISSHISFKPRKLEISKD